MKKSYITIVSKDDDENREPIYEINDSKTETLIALKTRPMTCNDVEEGSWSNPQEWLSEAIGNIDQNTKIYVASSYNEAKNIASEYNLKSVGSNIISSQFL